MKHLSQTITLTLLIAGLLFNSCKKERSCEGCQTNQSTGNTNNGDTITFYHLYWTDFTICAIDIDNILNTLPPGSTFEVYLRGQNHDGTWASWIALSQSPPATPGFYYEVVGSRLRVRCVGYDCSWDWGPYEHEYVVRIVVH